MLQEFKSDIHYFIEKEFVEEEKLAEDLKSQTLEQLTESGFAVLIDQTAQIRPSVLNGTEILVAGKPSLSFFRRANLRSAVELLESPSDAVLARGIVTSVASNHLVIVLNIVPSRFAELLSQRTYLRLTADLITKERCNQLYNKIDQLAQGDNAVQNIISFLDAKPAPTEHFNYLNKNLTNIMRGIDFSSQLNDFQKQAIKASIFASHFHLIHGPPGTGKTYTLMRLVDAFFQLGMRVLVSSMSNTAVDNLLVRCAQETTISKDQLLRLGNPLRASPEGLPYCLDYRMLNMPSNQGLSVKALLNHSSIVFSTHTSCFKEQHLLVFQSKPFDVVIIDEASQSPLPLVLMPLTLAKRAVFAGDHHQLPPVIKDQHRPSLKVSLFERIIVQSRVLKADVMTMLRVQYRMNEIICLTSSEHFYNGELVSHAWNQKQNLSELSQNEGTYLDVGRVIVWINHNLQEMESVQDNYSSANFGELEISLKVLVELVQVIGVAAKHIGVITPFAKQREYIQNAIWKLWKHKVGDFREVEVGTVDSFQGREKEVIVYGSVRCNPQGVIGFLREERRFNVAMTRAKRMFVMVGNQEMLCKPKTWSGGLNIFERYLQNVRRYGREILFDYGANEMRVFERETEEFVFKNNDRSENPKIIEENSIQGVLLANKEVEELEVYERKRVQVEEEEDDPEEMYLRKQLILIQDRANRFLGSFEEYPGWKNLESVEVEQHTNSLHPIEIEED
jgi:hypothetical protein